MEPRLSRYIWTHTRKDQLWILVVVALSMVPYFLSFDLPKQIVNGPIQGKGFKDGATQTFMHIDFDIPGLGNVTLFPGVELDRMSMLFALSAVFLLLVIVNGLFKFYINTYKGKLGERLLRRIRFELVDKILRFPPNQFKRAKGAEIASMVKDEVEPLGGFTGDAFVSPALLGGQALTALRERGMEVSSIPRQDAERIRHRLRDVFDKYNRQIGAAEVVELYVELGRLRTAGR